MTLVSRNSSAVKSTVSNFVKLGTLCPPVQLISSETSLAVMKHYQDPKLAQGCGQLLPYWWWSYQHRTWGALSIRDSFYMILRPDISSFPLGTEPSIVINLSSSFSNHLSSTPTLLTESKTLESFNQVSSGPMIGNSSGFWTYFSHYQQFLLSIWPCVTSFIPSWTSVFLSPSWANDTSHVPPGCTKHPV